ncbi:MAG: branched-chain amino acid ABC transporter permease [Candidatus Rokuibacteriota bacterium]
MTEYLIAIATIVGIQALVTMGLNVHYGITGLVNFGHVAFYALGAYASALLTLGGVPFLPAMAAGIVLAVLASLLVGTATLRLREDYFAILTLGFSELVRLLLLNARELTRGALGLPGIPRPLRGVAGVPDHVVYLALVLVALVLAFVLCEVLARSPLGRTLRAIRDDDQAAMALGKDVLRFRLVSLAWGASLAAVAGSLWAHYVTYVVPDQFTPEITFYAWMAMIVGGPGSMTGAVWGTAILVAVLEGTRFVKDVVPMVDEPKLAALRQVAIGVGLIVLTVYVRKLGGRSRPRVAPASIAS